MYCIIVVNENFATVYVVMFFFSLFIIVLNILSFTCPIKTFLKHGRQASQFFSVKVANCPTLIFFFSAVNISIFSLHMIRQDLPDMVAVKDADFSNVDAVFCCLPHGTTQVF